MSGSLEHFWRNPPASGRIYFLGICGIAMGSLALGLRRKGWQIGGCDQQADPPMSDLLRQAGIEIESIEDAQPGKVDLWVVGRSIPVDHPILAHLATGQAPVLSYPEALASLILCAERRWIVAGSKGKTTTTAMLAWIADQAGLSPDFLIGGVPGNFASGLRLENAALAILEGDEYASSPTDLTPKFAHYRPTDVILTNVFPDHIELYRDAAAGTRDFLPHVAGKVVTVGFEATNDERLTDYSAHAHGADFIFLGEAFSLPLLGRANALDAALATVAAQRLGIAPSLCARSLSQFVPVRERLQNSGIPGGVRFFVESNVHPDALATALPALRDSHPTGRLLCVAQPQYPGPGDGYVQHRLPEVLAVADHVLIAPIAGQAPDAYDPPFSTERLIADLEERGIDATYQNTRKGIVSWIVERARPGDTLLLAVHGPSRPYLLRELTTALEARAELEGSQAAADSP
jgi:UDP-N-acetylmuramate: L-alanyl-gamma-D-glutamyl-meso-diaminopimelate ligase